MSTFLIYKVRELALYWLILIQVLFFLLEDHLGNHSHRLRSSHELSACLMPTSSMWALKAFAWLDFCIVWLECSNHGIWTVVEDKLRMLWAFEDMSAKRPQGNLVKAAVQVRMTSQSRQGGLSARLWALWSACAALGWPSSGLSYKAVLLVTHLLIHTLAWPGAEELKCPEELSVSA